MITKYPVCSNGKELIPGDDVLYESNRYSIISTKQEGGQWFVSLWGVDGWVESGHVALWGSEDEKPLTKMESNYTRMAKAFQYWRK